MKSAISIRDFHKSYEKGKEVVKGISLEIKEGEIFCLLGKNGVGKSTTIDCLTGIKPFEKGEIELEGVSIQKDELKAKALFGYVPSEPMCYEDMTGYGYLSFIASVFKVSNKDFLSNVENLSKVFGLSDKDLRRPIKEYSHGMKQKVCLMASLVHNPKIWILDEPTVGLDAFVSKRLEDMFFSFASKGNTIFFASHNLEFVAKLSNRVGFLKDGLIKEVIDFDAHPELRGKLHEMFFDLFKKGEEI